MLLGVHGLVALHIAHWKFAGKTLTPLEPSEAGETLATGAINAGFVLFGLLLLSTLIFGRFFCGWACHVVAYQDASAWLLGKLGLRPRPVRSRLLVYVPLVAALLMFGPPLWEGASVERPREVTWSLTTEDYWGRFPGVWMALATFLVCGFGVVWLLGAKGFCTYACPYGGLFGLADRAARGRIRVSDACEGCGHCTATCTSNVRVHEEVARFGQVVDPGCMKCMDCVSVCPKDALSFGFRARTSRKEAGPEAQNRASKAYDFSLGEEFAMALVFAGALYAFRGLYGAVPFLLSLAMAVVAAVVCVAVGRFVRGRLTRLQHVDLSRGWRRPGGVAVVVLALSYLAFTVQSGFVQYQARAGRRMQELAVQAGTAEERERFLARSVRHLGTALRFGLVREVELNDRMAQAEYALGRADEAERSFRTSLELEPQSQSARVFLMRLLCRREAWDEAIHLAGELEALDPGNTEVRRAVALVLESEPAHAGALGLWDRVGG